MFLADVNDNAYILVRLCLSCTVIMCTHNIYSLLILGMGKDLAKNQSTRTVTNTGPPHKQSSDV